MASRARMQVPSRWLSTLLIPWVLAALAAVATAGIPSRDGSIHACYDVQSGDLRVIDFEARQRCVERKETELVWNVKGPAGSQGPPGRQGSQGVQWA